MSETSTSGNDYGLITLDSMLRAIQELPERPTMYAMTWLKVLPREIVLDNTIIVSMDLAKWLEEKGLIKFLKEPPHDQV